VPERGGSSGFHARQLVCLNATSIKGRVYFGLNSGNRDALEKTYVCFDEELLRGCFERFMLPLICKLLFIAIINILDNYSFGY
jgi:hypothetical protein